MWEEVLICICVYLGVFFILPDVIRRPLTSKRYILWTIGFGVALILLSAHGLYTLTRKAEKFQAQVDSTCGGVKCPSTCLFRASLSASGSLSGISYLSGYENCLIPGMDISGVHVSGSVRVESVSEASAQLDTSKTYTASASDLLSGSTNPVCYANSRALRSADQDQIAGFNIYGRYVRIYAPKDEIVCEFTGTLNSTGGLSNIIVTKGSIVPGMYIAGITRQDSVSLSAYNPTTRTGQLDMSHTYTSGNNLNLISTAKNETVSAFTATINSTGRLSNITITSGSIATGMYIFGTSEADGVRLSTYDAAARTGQVDSTKTYTAGSLSLRAKLSSGSISALTATLNSTGGLSNITVTSGSIEAGMYIFGTSQINSVSLSAYNPTTRTGNLNRSQTYTAGSLTLTGKLSDGSFGLSQVMVYNAKGDNIASGRPTTGTKSTFLGGGTASSVIDGTTIPRAAPNAMGSNRAWGNVNTLGRENDYWEVDLGTRQLVTTVRIISPNDYGDTKNISGGGGNRVKGLRIAILEAATETPSLDGKCAASPLIIYPVLTTGTQITDEEKKVVGPEILNGIDGEKVLRIYRLLNERYPTVQISDLRPYLSDDQIVRLYKSIENGNNVKDSTDGFITPANAQALRNLVKEVKTITDIPTTTVTSTPTAPAIRNFPDSVRKFMTSRIVITKRVKNSANGSPMMDGSGRPIIEDVSDRGIPAALIKLVEPLKPISQNNSSLGYSSGEVSGSAADGSAYSEENNVPADLASGGAPVENKPPPAATTNPDGSIRIAQTDKLSDIDAYLLQSGYQAPTGNLSKALPQWYLSIGPFSYNNAVLKCAEGGDKLVTLSQLRAAQAAGARYKGAGWIKDVTDRVYTIQDTPTTYQMLRAPYENCPAGTTGTLTGCSVTQTPVSVTGCPTGTTASSTGCSATLTSRNFDCPAGLTATTTGCNPLQLVPANRINCPAGTTASPTGCSAPLTAINRTNCPAGTTASATGCSTPVTYSNCPANYTASSATLCVPATTTRTNMVPTTYNKPSIPTTRTQGKGGWSYSCSQAGYAHIFQPERLLTDQLCYRGCLGGEITTGTQGTQCITACPSTHSIRNADNSCSSACPTGYNATNNTTCTFNGQNVNRTPICPANTTQSGTTCTAPGTCSGQIIAGTCYPSCPANTTQSGTETVCRAPGTCAGQIIAGTCYPSCPANTTIFGTTCKAPGSCTGGQVIAGVCYPRCPDGSSMPGPTNTTIPGTTTCTAPGTCAGRLFGGMCYPSCPANTAANGAFCQAAGECRKTTVAGACYYPCEAGETTSGTTCTGGTVTSSAPPATGASAHCYGMKESFWPSARSILASWTNRDISIPDGQIAPLPSVGSAPNQDPGGPIDIANTYKADDWNKRSKNDPLKNKEVFHISSRYIYTKSQAQAVCQSIGADLATYDQMKHAFNGGAQWCSTGWVKDKDVAYYPMQETGIAGCSEGYTAPSLIEYTPSNGMAAVNCYGIKPSRLENLFTLTNTGIITANKRGRYVRIFNTDKLANLKERYISLTQVLITDSADTVISTGATAIQHNPTKDWDPAANGYPDVATDVGAQKLLQYTTKQAPKDWKLGYQSSSRSEDQFVEIDLGKPFADRKGVIKNIEIVPHSTTGFGQTPDRATGLRVVISDAPYIYPYSNKVGQYAWNQTMLNLADSCGLSSDGTMKYKKTCQIGEGATARTINVCVTDMTVGCDQICVEGKTLQGNDCPPNRYTVPPSQYGAECDISFEFQKNQIGYLYSGKGVAAKDDDGNQDAAKNPYHSKDMAEITVVVKDKCTDFNVGGRAGPPPGQNGPTWQPGSGVIGNPMKESLCHHGTWNDCDSGWHDWTGTYGFCKHDDGKTGIAKASKAAAERGRFAVNLSFRDPAAWSLAQENPSESITRYMGTIKRATMLIGGRCEGSKRKYEQIESTGIYNLRAYAKELNNHNNSTGGAEYINLMKSYVNSADITSCTSMVTLITGVSESPVMGGTNIFDLKNTMENALKAIEARRLLPCIESGPLLYFKTAPNVNGPGACSLADGLPGWRISKTPPHTGLTFLEQIFRHAIIASPAPYAHRYSEEYMADIRKLTSGEAWKTEPAQIPVNSDNPPKPNFKLISFDARCCVTQNALFEVMSHIAAAALLGAGGWGMETYFYNNFTSGDDVIEACMRQGDNPNGGVRTLASGVLNFNQTEKFTPPVIGRYVRVRPRQTGDLTNNTLIIRQIVVKDPSGNRIPARARPRLFSWMTGIPHINATSETFAAGRERAYNNDLNSVYNMYGGAKIGHDAWYNEFWEVDLGGNKKIGSIDYFSPNIIGVPSRADGIRISVWPSKIGWDIPLEDFTTIDQNKYTIDRMVHAKVIDGTVRNYSQCVSDKEIRDWAAAAQLPGDDGYSYNTLRRICAPYFNTAVWTPGDASEARKGDYKINIGATNR